MQSKSNQFSQVKAKIVFITLGLASSIWFLIRVIPKPSRAAYPCMRISAPFMSAFVIWLAATLSAVVIFKKSIKLFKKAKYHMAFLVLIPALVFGIVSITFNLDPLRASSLQFATASDYPPNEPMGEANGIIPGRVVWSWNPDATNESCDNTVNEDGVINDNDDVYYLPRNNNESVIDGMLKEIMINLTSKSSIASAWDAVFKTYNNKVNKGDVGYISGEKIYIKTNNQGIGLSFTMFDDLSQDDGPVWGSYPPHMTATSPYAIRATIKQLVNETGIPQGDIYVGDPHNNFNNIYYDIIRADFPNINIMGVNDSGIDCEANGRTLSTLGDDDIMFYSDNGDKISGGSDSFYQELVDAEYIINIAAMKSHIRGGITLFCKSHFGSHTRGDAFHLHPGLVGENSGYGEYRVLTDIMGHKEIGGKTIISILDALWGGKPHELDEPRKYDMYPFNKDYTSSIMASIDPVAVASVAFDFLRTEYNEDDWGEEAYPNMYGTDDFLHQAADELNWPSGITYDPEDDGSKLPSLGTHEHWNNETDMQYSRNLGNGNGIELIKIFSGIVAIVDKSIEVDIMPNPASNFISIRGIAQIDDLTIYNTAGQLVYQKKNTNPNNVNISELKNGIYIIKIKTKGQQLTTQFIKE